MLRQALLSAAFALCTTGVFAQSEIGQWSIQPKAGINVATMTNSDGGDATVVYLPDEDIHGNSHFMFQEKNNAEIADLIAEWLEKHNL